ncbi:MULTISPECIES: hypothetical protein [unclassified Bradyrhizobium]|uniref:hypothetical protein n=1 Tax=unclassified Bradyrhizobium TaxID=2631580 RepID=UPI0033962CF5
MKDHKYDFRQEVYVENDTYTGIVKIAAKLPFFCDAHKAAQYGCYAEDRHFTFCEHLLTPVGRKN